jgi:crotonobetainyl-CoA:carnitine CoA-transferase CaiB-like acyl-CoA transferase
MIHNFRPGVVERLGISYQDVVTPNARIIVGSISGYGESGPYRAKKGQDLLAQAMSGAMWTNSFEGQPPVPIGNAVADHTAGQLLAYAIMAALYARERTGVGQHVSVSLLDAMVDLQLEPAFFYLNSGERYRRGPAGRGNPVGAGVPYGVYRTADARWLAISGSLSDVCRALDMGDLVKLPEYDTMEKQKADRETLWRRVEEAVGGLTAAEATARLDGADVWNALVYDYPETFRDPQVLHNGMLIEVENPRGGTYHTTGIPVKFERTPAQPRMRPPRFAEHTADILQWLGYGQDEIQDLARRGVVALGET